ncbi:hypothetical protein BaRGS_00005572, partial [Batillaria attramentaria]
LGDELPYDANAILWGLLVLQALFIKASGTRPFVSHSAGPRHTTRADGLPTVVGRQTAASRARDRFACSSGRFHCVAASSNSCQLLPAERLAHPSNSVTSAGALASSGLLCHTVCWLAVTLSSVLRELKAYRQKFAGFKADILMRTSAC